jgi:hypothetical protein
MVRKKKFNLKGKCFKYGKDGHMKANYKVEKKDLKKNVSNVEREVIWLMIVKERRMERKTKKLINLNQTN